MFSILYKIKTKIYHWIMRIQCAPNSISFVDLRPLSQKEKEFATVIKNIVDAKKHKKVI